MYLFTSVGGAGSGGLATVVFLNDGGYDSTTITFGGTGYAAGTTLQISAQTLALAIDGLGFGGPGGVTVSGPLNFTLVSGNIVVNPGLITSYGFLLSGSLTTSLTYGGAGGTNILLYPALGDADHPGGSSIPTSTYIPLTTLASPVGVYDNIPTTTTGAGVGMTVSITIASGIPNQINLSPQTNLLPISSTATYETTGGSGTGLTVSLTITSLGTPTGVDFNGTATTPIVNPGSGYINGEVVNIISENVAPYATGTIQSVQTGVSSMKIEKSR
jgi:hypothetical protein